MGIASSGDGERNAVRVHARCVSGRPADDQPVASDVKHTSCFFDVSGVLPREIMCMAGEARTRGACVSSVLCTRVLVCKAQGSERGRGSGEAEAWAKAGARRMSKNSVATERKMSKNAKRAYSHLNPSHF